jgi:hypothetical protein
MSPERFVKGESERTLQPDSPPFRTRYRGTIRANAHCIAMNRTLRSSHVVLPELCAKFYRTKEGEPYCSDLPICQGWWVQTNRPDPRQFLHREVGARFFCRGVRRVFS